MKLTPLAEFNDWTNYPACPLASGERDAQHPEEAGLPL